MDAALDDVAFLALSENRIALLEALSDEQTHSRTELKNSTDVSRPTLARILDDFESRAWISQIGQECQITPLGMWVHEEFTDLLAMMDTARQLRDAMRWLPEDAIDHGIVRRLNDAELVFATESDPTAPIRRSVQQLYAGTRLRFLTTQATVSYFAMIRDNVVNHGMSVKGVMTPAVCSTLVNSTTMATLCRELYTSDDVSLFVTEEPPPILQIIDGDVGIGLLDAAKHPRGIILSDDEAILAWAEETFESYREKAVRLSSEQFSRMDETAGEPDRLAEELGMYEGLSDSVAK